MENAKIAFPKWTVSVSVCRSCEKLEEITHICCLTEEIVDDPQNLRDHSHTNSVRIQAKSVDIAQVTSVNVRSLPYSQDSHPH